MSPETQEKVSTVLRTLPSVVTGFAYGGWSKDELAQFFGITPAKALQKMQAYRKTGAVLWRQDRVRVCALHMFAVECARIQEDAEMSELAIEARKAMMCGRHDCPNSREIDTNLEWERTYRAGRS